VKRDYSDYKGVKGDLGRDLELTLKGKEGPYPARKLLGTCLRGYRGP